MDNSRITVYTHAVYFVGKTTKHVMFYFNENHIPIPKAMDQARAYGWKDKNISIEKIPRATSFPKYKINDVVAWYTSRDVIYTKGKIVEITWTGKWTYKIDKNGHYYMAPEDKIIDDETVKPTPTVHYF